MANDLPGSKPREHGAFRQPKSVNREQRLPLQNYWARCQIISNDSRNEKRFKCSSTTLSIRDAVSSSGTVSAIAKMFSFDVITHCPAGNGISARVSFHVRSGNLWLQCFAS